MHHCPGFFIVRLSVWVGVLEFAVSVGLFGIYLFGQIYLASDLHTLEHESNFNP